MSLKPEPISPIPQETARLAKAVFPEGSTFIKMCNLTCILSSSVAHILSSTQLLTSCRSTSANVHSSGFDT